MKKVIAFFAVVSMLTFSASAFAQVAKNGKETFQLAQVQQSGDNQIYEFVAADMSETDFAHLQDYRNFQMAPSLILHDDFVGYHFVIPQKTLKVVVKAGGLSQKEILGTLNLQMERLHNPIAQNLPGSR